MDKYSPYKDTVAYEERLELDKKENAARAQAESATCPECFGRMKFDIRETDGQYLAVCKACGHEEEI